MTATPRSPTRVAPLAGLRSVTGLGRPLATRKGCRCRCSSSSLGWPCWLSRPCGCAGWDRSIELPVLSYPSTPGIAAAKSAKLGASDTTVATPPASRSSLPSAGLLDAGLPGPREGPPSFERDQVDRAWVEDFLAEMAGLLSNGEVGASPVGTSKADKQHVPLQPTILSGHTERPFRRCATEPPTGLTRRLPAHSVTPQARRPGLYVPSHHGWGRLSGKPGLLCGQRTAAGVVAAEVARKCFTP